MISKRFQRQCTRANGFKAPSVMFALVVGCAAVLSGAAATAATPAETVAVLPAMHIGIETATEAGSLKVAQTLALCPAAAAGIKRGDRLTQLNGKPLRSLPP